MSTDTHPFNLTIHHLRFKLEAQTTVHLGAQAGAQFRGALWAALKQFACTNPSITGQPGHSEHCPMCRLVALETQSARGVNPARPFAIQPPLADNAEQDRLYASGETFEIGISLFGDAADLFPYVCQAVHRVGEIGVGYGRGQFIIRDVRAVNPLTGQSMRLMQTSPSGSSLRIITGPGLPVTNSNVSRAVQSHACNTIGLRFLTPTHITYRKRALTRPDFGPLIARLLERCQSLELHYTSHSTPHPIWRERHLRLTQAAQQIHLRTNYTRWISIHSGSRRSNRRNSIGGLIGQAIYEGELSPFLPWLFWGQSIHVGKNAVKGNGWYEILHT